MNRQIMQKLNFNEINQWFLTSIALNYRQRCFFYLGKYVEEEY